MTEEQNDSYVVIVRSELGHNTTYETKGVPLIDHEDDAGHNSLDLFIREGSVSDGHIVGVLAAGSWNSIEVKKGTKG